jgi:hypothetical protein
LNGHFVRNNKETLINQGKSKPETHRESHTRRGQGQHRGKTEGGTEQQQQQFITKKSEGQQRSGERKGKSKAASWGNKSGENRTAP